MPGEIAQASSNGAAGANSAAVNLKGGDAKEFKKAASTATKGKGSGTGKASEDSSAKSQKSIDKSTNKAIEAFKDADAGDLATALLGDAKYSRKQFKAVKKSIEEYQANPDSLRPDSIREAQTGYLNDKNNTASDLLPLSAEGVYDPSSNTALIASDVVNEGGKRLDGTIQEEVIGGPLASKVSEQTGIDFSGDAGARIAGVLAGGTPEEAIASEKAERGKPGLSDNIDARINGHTVTGIPARTITALTLRGTYIENGAHVSIRLKDKNGRLETYNVTDGDYYSNSKETGENHNLIVGVADSNGISGEITIRAPDIFDKGSVLVTVDNPTEPDLQFTVYGDKPDKTALTAKGQGDTSQNAPWVQKNHITFDPSGPFTQYPGENYIGQEVVTKATDAGVKFLRAYHSVTSQIDNFAQGNFKRPKDDPEVAARVERAKAGTFTTDDKALFHDNVFQSNLIDNGLN